MIDITINDKRDLDKIFEDFYQQLEPKIKLSLNTHLDFLNSFNTKSGHKLGLYIKTHLKQIITADLNTVLAKHETELKMVFNQEYKNKSKGVSTEFKIKINEIFNFENFTSFQGYSFTKTLGINVCPYCNRNYITTIGNRKSKFVRPDIDHFFPKHKYPYLRLSFYNLIPSCVICNRNAKGKTHMSLSKNIHPYIEGFGDDAKFIHIPKTYRDLIGKGNPEIDFTFSNNISKVKRIKENIKVFRLKEQYLMHSKELNHLIELKEAFTLTYINDLIERYPKLKLTKEEAYYYAFGSIYSGEEHESQPLSKFKRDILEHIDMINI